MSKVGNVLDKIFKQPLDGKVNLSIETIITFIFDEFGHCKSQSKDRKEWEDIKTKFNFFSKINKTISTDSYDIRSSDNIATNDIDDIYKFIITDEKSKKNKKKPRQQKATTKCSQSFDSEVEMFKKVLQGETVSAHKVIKIKPCLTQEWIDKCVKKCI
jgi:hypothetical protein